MALNSVATLEDKRGRVTSD